MNINYYLNFKEEKRLSMDEYAEELITFQKKKFDNYNIQFFRPKLNLFNKLIPNIRLKMRYARYISYPRQIKNLSKFDISHICDQQYGHLYKYINSKIKIITVNDLVPIVLENKTKHNPRLLKFSLNNLKFFDHVIAISEATKRDILKYTDCPENKITVLMRAVNSSLFNESTINQEEVCNFYKIPFNKIKILIEGNVFYKNNDTAFKTLRELLKINNEIVFIKIGGKSDLKNFADLKDKVFDLPFISKNKLHEIYKICKVFFVPTIYTGGSLPIIESMKCGTPIVCSNTNSIMEVVKDTALISDPYDIENFVKNILEIINNEQIYIDKKKSGIERSNFFQIENFHNSLINIYREKLDNLKSQNVN
jgi:glycosyltransferase involved in cell wall biosynthesis